MSATEVFPRPASSSTISPVPFTLSISDHALASLNSKLSTVQFPNELSDAGWEYDGYDWRKHERDINASLPQFTADISVEGFETLNIHFVHKRSAVESAIPLLFVHGWPGSFLEVAKILPLLTAPSSEKDPSFHVVAFSLPGYGFSEAPKTKGLAEVQYAEVGHKLMQGLGYEEYVTQGGDWGYIITRKIAQIYGGRYCKASHTNMPFGLRPQLLTNPFLYLKHLLTPYTATEKAGLARFAWFRERGSGYAALQSTQPQTVGYSLNDSPVGLLAWIYEKIVTWTDGYPWTDDEIITWVSIYWVSRGGPAASLRIYYEAARTGAWDPSAQIVPRHVPIGISLFPKELFVLPKTWMHTLANVVFIGEYTKGGHFAAYERPQELVGDVRAMFRKGAMAFGVVPGKTGYRNGVRGKL
ncbi:Alpha/Beta hydrolase protein [Gautieria morchelliformis]|nr:Alpha/Beta hydrolase protein [Gautieria morchelliformis]